jgi:hypothetical protein
LKHSYTTPAAFRTALDARLRGDPRGLVFARKRLVFERYLARLVLELGDSIVLKGGLALVQRSALARSTIDIDLRVTGDPAMLLPRAQRAGRIALADHLQFEVTYVAPITNPGLHYEAQRYRVKPTIASRLYGDPFHLDCAFAEPIVGEPALHSLPDTLAFIDEAPATIRLYPIVSHIAEKLHAYTFTYQGGRPSSRVKDLPDLALLATTTTIATAELQRAFTTTFEHRRTHPLPSAVPRPAADWQRPYAKLAEESGLPWPDLDAAYTAVAAFLDPVLGARDVTRWEPATWTWT